MKTELERLLRGEEGVVAHAYQDSKGFWTIGVGRLVDKRKGGRLRPDEISYLLHNDIDECINELHSRLPWFDSLDDARKGVLIAMAFQMGIDGLLKFERTLKLIEEGKYDLAAHAMLSSKWATQTPARAARASEQMRTGLWVFPK